MFRYDKKVTLMISRKLNAVACSSPARRRVVQPKDEQNGDKKEEWMEIKYLVPEDNIETVSKNLHLDADHPSATRVTCFYDTDTLTLFTHERL
jgi:hypothetical protein